MHIDHDLKLDYSNVLIRPKRSTLSSRKEVSLEREFNFRNSEYDYKGVPIMASNMDGVGTFDVADELAKQGLFTCLVKTYSKEDLIEFFKGEEWRTDSVAMSVGIAAQDYDKFVQVKNAVGDKLKYLCIDVANGYTERFVEHIRFIREKYSDITIIAGNVVTADQTQELILNGADIIKVGLGSGSVCTTRLQTGVGYPQLSAVMECADAAHGLGGHIIADGGCICPGDVAKAFAAGADFVMLGGMLAGTDQGGGEVITKIYSTGEMIRTNASENGMSGTIPFTSFWAPVVEEKKFVQFYGMSSDTANEKHFGGLKNYRSSEGRTVTVPYKGDIRPVVQDILGGIRSTCTYAGALSLKQLSKCTTFVRCSDTHNRVFEKT
jgi:GMP reductase